MPPRGTLSSWNDTSWNDTSWNASSWNANLVERQSRGTPISWNANLVERQSRGIWKSGPDLFTSGLFLRLKSFHELSFHELPWYQNTKCQHLSLQGLPKFTQIGIFGLKIHIPSGNTDHRLRKTLRFDLLHNNAH
jgi:hypothetical protein